MTTKGCDPLVAMRPEDCPVQITVDVIAGKWKPLILFYLKHRTIRFSELRRLIPDATRKMLAQQLRELERAGVVTRKVYPEVPPRVEYSLSAYGQTLRPVLAAMADWGDRYRQEHLTHGRTAMDEINKTRKNGDNGENGGSAHAQ